MDNVVIIKVNMEDIMCELIFTRKDHNQNVGFFKGLFGKKDELLDPYTGNKCIVVRNALKLLHQVNLADGNITTIMIKWIQQTQDSYHMLPSSSITTISRPSEDLLNDYINFFMKDEKNKTSEKINNSPIENTPKNTKSKDFRILTPTHYKIH